MPSAILIAGVWDVKHQRGHVEGRKTDQREWPNEERGDVDASSVGGAGGGTRNCVPERLVNKIKLPVRVHVVPKRWNRGNYLLTCSGNCVGIIR
jgi:hypothetical protein